MRKYSFTVVGSQFLFKQHFLSHLRLPVEVTLGGGLGTHDTRYRGKVHPVLCSGHSGQGRRQVSCRLFFVFRGVSPPSPFHDVCARPQSVGHPPCTPRAVSTIR